MLRKARLVGALGLVLSAQVGCTGTAPSSGDDDDASSGAGSTGGAFGSAGVASAAGGAVSLAGAGGMLLGGGGSPAAGGGSAGASSGGAPSSSCSAPYQGALPAGRGMDTPWIEHQAEDGQTNATVLGPSRAKWDASHIEAEAVGRKAVRLAKVGDYVSVKTTQPANSIVVRFSIPDAPGGGGIDATLGLYVNGQRVRSLPLTSRYSWVYGGTDYGDPKIDIPAENPHTFFDETRLLLDDIPAGAEVKLQKDAMDQADFYVIDLLDFEQVPPPLSMPAGFTSVADFGALPDDGKEDGDQIVTALSKTEKLWFPKGTYTVRSLSGGRVGLDNLGGEVRGAGEWYTVLEGAKAMFFCKGADSQCVFGNFSILGDTKFRAESLGVQKAFVGPMGNGSLIENVWVEHLISGMWIGDDPPYQQKPTENLTIRNVRVRNVVATAVNLGNGTSNSIVENSHVRNSGDEGFIVWSIKWTDWVKALTYTDGPNAIKEESRNQPDQGVAHGNVFRKLSVQMPWRAVCFAAYGGNDNLFEDSTCEDVLAYPGLYVVTEFWPYPFGSKLTTFRNITLLRAGGTEWFEKSGMPIEHGALKFYRRQGSITDVLVENVDIIDPTYSGIEFRGFGSAYGWDGLPPWELEIADKATFENVSLKNVNVTGACSYGIQVRDGGGKGNVAFQDVVVTGAARGGLDKGGAPDSFFSRASGNQGW